MPLAIAESLGVLLLLICAAWALRKRGVLDVDDSSVLSRLITDLLLPALVFASLSRHPIQLHHLAPSLIMLVTTLALFLLAWWAGRRCRLESTRLGAFILVTGIGSSSTLGYSLISQVYPNDLEAAFTAVMIGEIGVILPLFLVGIPIAIHFGQHPAKSTPHRREFRAFLLSPIFIAIVLGIAVSWIDIPDTRLTNVFYRALDLLGNTLPVFVALSVGLMLRLVSISDTWIPITIVLLIKLLLEPFVVAELAVIGHLSQIEKNILVIEAAMPSGTIAAVIAQRYGCDGGFASLLVIVSYGVSILTVPLVAALAT